MQIKSKAVATIVVIILCSVVLTAFSGQSSTKDSTVVYKESPIERGNITAGITESGTASIEGINVNYDQTATLEEIYVKPGQRVAVGDKIAKLSVSSIQEEIDLLNSKLKQAQLKYEQAVTGKVTSDMTAEFDYNTNLGLANTAQATYDMTVAGLELDLETAANNLVVAKQKRKYYQSMLDGETEFTDKYNGNKEITDTEAEDNVDQLDDQIDTLTLKYHQTENTVAQGKTSAELKLKQDLAKSGMAKAIYDNTIQQTDASLENAQLEVETIQADIKEASEYLTDGIITAPSAGMIMSIGYAVGDKIKNTDSMTSSPIVTIGNTDNVYVSVSIDQEDITSLAIGKEAEAVLSAFEDLTFDAVIDSIQASPARGGTSTVSYTVTVKLIGDTSQIYQGMSADVTFISKQVENVLYVSNRAVTAKDGKQYLKIKDSEGNPVEIEVVTGFSDGRNVEIVSGVSEGDIALIESMVKKS